MGVPVIQQAKIQAQVLVPLVKALQAELGEERANALVRRALGDIYRRYGEEFWRTKNEKIAAALQMARDDAAQFGLALEPDSLVFPACSQISAREALPARGNMLRHTYRTVAADLGVDDLLIHFLMGHTPRGISRKYVAVLILANGPAMRAAQERISARTLKELGLTFKTLRQEIVAGLAQSLEGGQGKALKNARALAWAARASARARRGKPSRPHSAETKAKISAAMKKSKAAAPG